MMEAVALAGIFLGVLARTTMPYLRKLREGRTLHWDHKYTLSALYSLVVASSVAMLAFPAFQIPSDGVLYVFAVSFGFGAGLNELINEVQAWVVAPQRP